MPQATEHDKLKFVQLDGGSQFGVMILRSFINRFGLEGTLYLADLAFRLEHPPSPLPDDYPIDNLEISVRTGNMLKRHGLDTVGKVREQLRKDPNSLMKYVKHYGRRSDNDIKDAIGWNGR